METTLTSEVGEKTEQGHSLPVLKFSRNQYAILTLCSKKKDMSEWNQWRKEHPDEKVLLEGADLQNAWLEGADLQNADLLEANLRGANLRRADLRHAYLWKSNLRNAEFSGADMRDADLWGANLQDARFWKTDLECADLGQTNLQGAYLQEADLQGAGLASSSLQGANFSRAIVDGRTLIWECKVDRDTNFEGVGLGNARIDPATKQLLEYNVRRTNWIHWYRKEGILKKITKRLFIYPFWSISDYGLSTDRIVKTFLFLTFFFATVYFLWGAVDYYYFGIEEQPGLVKDLFVNVAQGTKGIEGVKFSKYYYLLSVYLRSIYLTIVNMTTLGFSDTQADILKPGVKWWAGHSLLIIQVILSYVLLAALVTRFIVLFAAGGPAGAFSKRTSVENYEPDDTEYEPRDERQQESQDNIQEQSEEEPQKPHAKHKHKPRHKAEHKPEAEEPEPEEENQEAQQEEQNSD